MLRLIPPPLHRLAYRTAHALRRHWWRWRKPSLEGTRVIAMNGDEQVLMIRHSYGSSRWMLPGGGLRRGEDPLDAARREFREETGCKLSRPSRVTVSQERLHGAWNRVHVVIGAAVGTPRVDRREVIDAAFFPLDELPRAMSSRLRRDLPEWVRAAKAAHLRRAARPPAPPPATTG